MASVLPYLSLSPPPLLLLLLHPKTTTAQARGRSSSSCILHHRHHIKPSFHSPSPLPRSLPLTSLQMPPVQVTTPPAADDLQQARRYDFYVNLGLAVRTLREDLPLIFTKDLNYDIYRDDITFLDPLNKFTGIDNYKLIFWALRFQSKILFREISPEVYRIWQPSENLILIRWNLRGVPWVPWEAKGQFQGTSRYKLDRNGKIYEHKVDNLAFNLPQHLKPEASVLNLVAASCPASPNPTFLWGAVDIPSSSWVQLYRAVKEMVDKEGCLGSSSQPTAGLVSSYS